MSPHLTISLPPELVAELVAAVLAELGDREERSPYMTVDEAAEHARCRPQRIYDLRSSGRLSRVRDGSRALVLRQELDALLREWK